MAGGTDAGRLARLGQDDEGARHDPDRHRCRQTDREIAVSDSSAVDQSKMGVGLAGNAMSGKSGKSGSVAIEFRDVGLYLGGKEITQNIEFNVRKGEFVCV